MLKTHPSVAGESVRVFRPLIQEQEIQAAVEALEMGWLGMGSYLGEFEAGLKQYLEAEDRHVKYVGYRYHMANLHGAIGLGDVAWQGCLDERR